MQAITSQKARKRAVKDFAFVESQIVDLKRRKAEAMAGFDVAESLLNDTLTALGAAMRKWDEAQTPTEPEQKTLGVVA